MTRKLILLLAFSTAAAACAGILGYRKAGRSVFEHRAHLLRGVSCIKCHSGIDKAGDSGELHIPTTADCIGCHKKPHNTSECSNCHGQPNTRGSAMAAKQYLKFSHGTHTPRVRGNCVRCHADATRDGTALRPTMASCFGCHAHKDQWRIRDCDGCHQDLPAELTRPRSHLIHDGDFMSEHGVRAAAASDLCATCHSQRYCASCHGQTAPSLPEQMAFDNVVRAGVHRAGFRSRHAEEARAQPGLCSTCHSQNSCQSCHSGLGLSATVDDPRSPHPPGWLGAPGQANDHGRAAWRNPAECASCHGGAGEAMCVGCHRVGGVGGNPHPPGWTSRRSMTELPCLLCHRGRL